MSSPRGPREHDEGETSAAGDDPETFDVSPEQPDPEASAGSPDQPDPAGSDPPVEPGQASGSGGTVPAPQPQAVRTALATLPVPHPDERFWNQLDAAVKEEAPLQIMPRPAIRPITQPPPRVGGDAVEDVFDQGGHRSGRGRGRLRLFRRRKGASPGGGSWGRGDSSSGRGDRSAGRQGRRRLVVLLAIAALVVLAAVGGLFDDESTDGEDPGDQVVADGDSATTEVSDSTAGTEDGEGAETRENSEEEPVEDDPVQTVETQLGPDIPMYPGGMGFLRTGTMTLGDVAAFAGVDPEVNTNAFDFSSGTCFDAYLPGADDVTLWFRSPDAALGEPAGVEDPNDAILVALSVPRDSAGSVRRTDAGVHWGMSEEELVAAYETPLRPISNPRRSDGSVYFADDPAGGGNAIAYFTGYGQVMEIRTGHAPLISTADICY